MRWVRNVKCKQAKRCASYIYNQRSMQHVGSMVEKFSYWESIFTSNNRRPYVFSIPIDTFQHADSTRSIQQPNEYNSSTRTWECDGRLSVVVVVHIQITITFCSPSLFSMYIFVLRTIWMIVYQLVEELELELWALLLSLKADAKEIARRSDDTLCEFQAKNELVFSCQNHRFGLTKTEYISVVGISSF